MENSILGVSRGAGDHCTPEPISTLSGLRSQQNRARDGWHSIFPQPELNQQSVSVPTQGFVPSSTPPRLRGGLFSVHWVSRCPTASKLTYLVGLLEPSRWQTCITRLYPSWFCLIIFWFNPPAGGSFVDGQRPFQICQIFPHLFLCGYVGTDQIVKNWVTYNTFWSESSGEIPDQNIAIFVDHNAWIQGICSWWINRGKSAFQLVLHKLISSCSALGKTCNIFFGTPGGDLYWFCYFNKLYWDILTYSYSCMPVVGCPRLHHIHIGD